MRMVLCPLLTQSGHRMNTGCKIVLITSPLQMTKAPARAGAFVGVWTKAYFRAVDTDVKVVFNFVPSP